MREPAQIAQVKANPHSPGHFRSNGTPKKQSGVYESFKVKQGGRMYLAPKDRVIIW